MRRTRSRHRSAVGSLLRSSLRKPQSSLTAPLPFFSSPTITVSSEGRVGELQRVRNRPLRNSESALSPTPLSERHVVSREMDGDCLNNSSDDEAARRRSCRLFPQFLQQGNAVRVFEARNVSKAGGRGICTKRVLQCLVEKRQAEKNEHDLKRLGSEPSLPEFVRRTRSS